MEAAESPRWSPRHRPPPRSLLAMAKAKKKAGGKKKAAAFGKKKAPAFAKKKGK